MTSSETHQVIMQTVVFFPMSDIEPVLGGLFKDIAACDYLSELHVEAICEEDKWCSY